MTSSIADEVLIAVRNLDIGFPFLELVGANYTRKLILHIKNK